MNGDEFEAYIKDFWEKSKHKELFIVELNKLFSFLTLQLGNVYIYQHFSMFSTLAHYYNMDHKLNKDKDKLWINYAHIMYFCLLLFVHLPTPLRVFMLSTMNKLCAQPLTNFPYKINTNREEL